MVHIEPNVLSQIDVSDALANAAIDMAATNDELSHIIGVRGAFNLSPDFVVSNFMPSTSAFLKTSAPPSAQSPAGNAAPQTPATVLAPHSHVASLTGAKRSPSPESPANNPAKRK